MKIKILALFLNLCCVCNFVNASNPFVVGELTGQLGNQMFVIAATYSLALDHDADAIFPDLVNRLADNTPLNFKKVFPHLNHRLPADASIASYYREPYYHFNEIPYHPNMYMAGYFQSEKYFAHHKQEIIDLFAPQEEIVDYLQAKYGELINQPNTIAVHLRSYLDHDPSQSIYPLCSVDYFEQAMSLFPDDSVFLIFSNDMALSKRFFGNMPRNIIFIEGEAHYHDLYLMSLCQHNIISNSSFSWWGAYLNNNPNKVVVAPALWLTKNSGLNCKDVIPEEWVVLE